MKNKINFKILVPLYLILIIGIYMVYSSSRVWANYIYNDGTYYLKRQFIFLILGTIMLFIGMKVNLNRVKKHTGLLLLLSLVLLALLLIPGLGVERGGSVSWFGIGDFLFQPSEFFKIAIVLYMANKLTDYYLQTNKFVKVIIPLLLPAIFGFFLIMLQPDFGSGLVMLAAVVIMCMVSKSRFKNYIFIGLVGTFAFAFLIISASYRVDRILAFFNPWKDPLGSGFQIIQSLYAISPGGLIGRGIDGSFQKFFYLPEPQTDFIFAIYAEEFGFIGSLILIFLYIYLLNQCFKSAMQSTNEFASFLKIGFTS